MSASSSGAVAWINWPAVWFRCKYTKENDPDIIDRTYEFYRKAGFRRELTISEPGVQGILDFLSETVPEAKKATPAQFFDDRFVRQLNSER